jgi:tetratricopeptide (TPR) repeat protein
MELLIAGALSLLIGTVHAANLPDVPDGAQALTLTGKPLYAAPPGQKTLDQLAEARKNYEANPNDADNIIWYGRRTAYSGDFRGAIEIYSEGIEKFPGDDRMYRHRGHRHISIREFDRAIADLETAAKLIEGKQNETEPDGQPNEQNIPVSSRHGNIWYHLGLAYYLKQDWENAFRAYQNGFNAGRNDDNRVSTTHWLYMIKRRMGDEGGAARVLDVVTADMNVIENFSYHKLCLFYKGELTEQELIGEGEDTPTGAAAAYGLANWYYYTGEHNKAEEHLRALVETDSWAAFGFIAAEADLALR